MSQPLDLNDPFERQGLWWSSDDPDDRVTGTLTFDQEKGGRLALVGTLGNAIEALTRIGQPMVYRTIHGLSVDGKSISLLRAVQGSSQFNSPGMVVETYHALYVVVGCHIQSLDDELFDRSEINFDGLNEWLGDRVHQETFERNPWRVTIVCESAERPLGRVSAIGASVSAATVAVTHRERLRGFNVTALPNISIGADRPRSVVWHLEQTDCVRRLAALCAGRHLPTISVRLFGPEKQIAEGVTVPGEYDVLYRVVGDRQRKGARSDTPIFSASELLDENIDALERWFAVADELKPTIDLLFTYLSSNSLYVESAFLLVVQALEVFHRLTDPTSIMDEDKYDEVRASLLAAIPKGTSSDMREKLTSTLLYSNEPSLRQRLKRTITQLNAVYGPAPFGFDQATIGKVVDTRNYYTHYSAQLRARAVKGAQLHSLTQRFVPLLFVLLFSQLGLSNERVRDNLKRRQGF
ncbi:MAG: HEPN domain-containing protein [Parcubacteria group bacterium]